MYLLEEMPDYIPSKYKNYHTDAICMSFWPVVGVCCPICFDPEDEQLGLGDLTGEPLPFVATFSALAKLRARRNSPDVTVAVDADEGVDVPLESFLSINKIISKFRY